MRRYWVEEKDIIGDQALLQGEVFHHIVEVCRQTVGSKFELLSNGKAHFSELIALSKKGATARIIETRNIPALPKPYIKIALCIPRFPVLESILEKAVELGVDEIQLLSSQYSFIKSSEKISESKWERWLKVIKSSTQQSGRGDLMKLTAPMPLIEWSKKMNPNGRSLCLFGYEGPSPLSIREYFKSDKSHGELDDAWILVGGEGGFSEQEVQLLAAQGCQAVTLGPQVLRVETACITLTSILKYELDLMRGS